MSGRPGSSSLHAVLPAQAPPPFPEPTLLSARRVSGLVFTNGLEDVVDGETFVSSTPTTLERRPSVAGNILLVNTDKETTKAFMLQRKIKNTMFGSIRVGYVLKDKPKNENSNGVVAWEVETGTSGIYEHELVAVTIEDKSKVLQEGLCNTAQDPKTELSALQMVAALLDPKGEGAHVVGSSLIAADDAHVYTITPYHKEGSLFEYCMGAGTLSESDARFFFRQILKGLATLQSAEICHRDLNLQNILLRGSSCTILGLACALRIPTEPDSGIPHMIEPQPPCTSNPQTAAPELLRNEPFDGYAVDLWAAGVMLFTMLYGSDALFAAPVMDDRKFRVICDGNLRLLTGHRKNNSDGEQSHAPISDSAIELLQQMLCADPRSRPTLAQVQQHPWVVASADEDPGSAPKVPLRPITGYEAS